MCGILGLVAPLGGEVACDDRAVVRMRDAMAARGPDGAGLERRRNVVFAHRRLAIRDRTAGAQPLVSDDGRYWLVYNGEIDDRELRGDLERSGHRFRTRCDTEVVLAAYREWGLDFVRRLRGMFALGLYDFRDDVLVLVRDRFGVKPLFVAEIEGCLVFASTVAALLAHPAFSARPNFRVVSQYLTTFRLTAGRETFYEGIWQLAPAERLVRNGGSIRVDRWWSPPAQHADEPFEESVSALERGLREAVRVRLASDVPVGILLSGGVDSNLLADVLHDETGPDVPSLCGGGDEDPGGEFDAAARGAQRLGFAHDEVRVSEGAYRETWRKLVAESALPLSTPTDVVLHRLAESFRPRAGVVLGGEGADEVLCGYGVQHRAGHDFELARAAAAGRFPGEPTAERLFRTSLVRWYGRDRFDDEVDHYFALNSLVPSAAKPDLLRPEVWEACDADRLLYDVYRKCFEESEADAAQDRTAHVLLRINLEGLLARLDTATMSAGLEARVPYADHVLVERMWRMPVERRIDVRPDEPAPYLAAGELAARGTLRPKRVLRALAERRLPGVLARRAKASFPTPVARWLAGPWREWAAQRLRTSRFARDLFRPEALEAWAADVPRAGMTLWPVLNLVEWGESRFAA